MQLTRFQIQQITCFESIELVFEETSEGPPPWIVFVGENGTGKSTLLQMIAAALMGEESLRIVAGRVDWARLKRRTRGGFADAETQNPNTVLWFGNRSLGVEILPQGGLRDYLRELNEGLTQWFYFGGYSAWGRAAHAGSGQSNSNPLPSVSQEHPAYRFVTLLGDDNPLINASTWIRTLFNQAHHPNQTEEDRALRLARFQRVVDSLLRVLPGISNISVNVNDEIEFTSEDAVVSPEQFSDGYRGMLAWSIDLIKRLYDAFPNSEDPLQEPGIVLLDEIDMHLHPRWQRRVVEDIRTIFPNIQFIITTHSPFVIQDMREADHIVLLERQQDGGVTARQDSRDLQHWSANQILSAYFGLSEGTRSVKAIQQEKRYQELLDQKHTEGLDQTQGGELESLTAQMASAPVGENPTRQKVTDAARLVLEALDRFDERGAVE